MEQDVMRFVAKLRRIIDGERDRGLTYSECIGCLEIVKGEIILEEINEGEENED